MNQRFLLQMNLAAGAVVMASGLAFAWPRPAEACGCISPPVPLDDDDFAVNQQAEQIVFEVGEGTVSAHVVVRFAGNPEEFAWLVPVPNVVDVQLSESMIFPLLDQVSQPQVSVGLENLCPDPIYQCKYHSQPDCGGGDEGEAGEGGDDGNLDAGEGDGDNATGGGTTGVHIDLQKQIGSYEVVAFSADEAELAVTWLQENGFIVNASMSPYMQPYIDRGMHFVAAKLVPGAGVNEIRPLKLIYEGEHPMIPLKLTAVAAEPHMPIIAYIYGQMSYGPMTAPVIELDTQDLFIGADRVNNYPALLARNLDEAGGAGFVVDYWGPPRQPDLNQDDYCCTDEYDYCGVAENDRCECPLNPIDRVDCGEIEGLEAGIRLLEQLGTHRSLTRLSTLMSPEEMTFDPMFAVHVYDTPQGNARLQGQQKSLARCELDVIDQAAYAENQTLSGCSQIYCGQGRCGWTDLPEYGCQCDEGQTARSYTNLYGQASVTCVPEVGTVDLGIGIEIPDVCASVNCGAGTCIDVGGFPTCRCHAGSVAVLERLGDEGSVLHCKPAVGSSGDSGARDYSEPLEELAVCIPKPPSCGRYGWLVGAEEVDRVGELCDHSIPDVEQLIPPAKPTCEGGGGDWGSDAGDGDAGSGSESSASGGTGCATAGGNVSLGAMAGIAALVFGIGRRSKNR